ncbi:PREDICTED: putative sodium-dependent multivitamin transporter [Rhagoletis zephyria]|uniref:putative sodium-dependent multivitamin transporter n=1 Tax=Rhagoletis zephyria TaxID=28612 RepID=UPI0008115780|nr:PREDICTED: putative sodium-dependent multivitamin transporter [Rhagoletis zephyria]
MASFGALDYGIVAIVLIISAAIGIYYRLTGGKQQTTKEYLLADRQMSILPVAFSLMTSFMSAVTLLGVSMENYQYGTMFVLINISYVLSTPAAAYLILPVFYRLKTASVYEYLELRFGYATRLCASLAFTIQMTLYMGIVLYAPALALEAVTGLNQNFSVVVVGVVCTFYATLGGMKAVLITDIFQSLLMFVSVFSVIICATIKAGSWGEIWRVAGEGGRLQFLDFSVDPTVRHTWWTQIIGGMATYLSLYGVNQTQVQRLLSARNLKSSQASLWWNLPILIPLSFSTCFSGLCIYYFYKDCDPLLEGRISSRDQLMPLFVVDTMGGIPGLSGLFVAGIFSASLSTISSAISSLAAVTVEDYLKPLLLWKTNKPLNESKSTWFSKFFNLIYGAACIGLAFLAGSLTGVLQAALSIFGIVGGPLLGLFTLGMYFTFVNQKGAITGLITSLAFCFWIGFGQPRPTPKTLEFSTEGCSASPPTSHVSDIFTPFAATAAAEAEEPHYFYLYRISYMWYSVIGFLVTLFMGLVCSWLYAKLGWDSNAHIYTDSTCTTIKYDLFVPPLARRLRNRQVPVVVVTGTSSEIGGGSATPSTVEDDAPLPKSDTGATELSMNELDGSQKGEDVTNVAKDATGGGGEVIVQNGSKHAAATA